MNFVFISMEIMWKSRGNFSNHSQVLVYSAKCEIKFQGYDKQISKKKMLGNFRRAIFRLHRYGCCVEIIELGVIPHTHTKTSQIVHSTFNFLFFFYNNYWSSYIFCHQKYDSKLILHNTIQFGSNNNVRTRTSNHFVSPGHKLQLGVLKIQLENNWKAGKFFNAKLHSFYLLGLFHQQRATCPK